MLATSANLRKISSMETCGRSARWPHTPTIRIFFYAIVRRLNVPDRHTHEQRAALGLLLQRHSRSPQRRANSRGVAFRRACGTNDSDLGRRVDSTELDVPLRRVAQRFRKRRVLEAPQAIMSRNSLILSGSVSRRDPPTLEVIVSSVQGCLSGHRADAVVGGARSINTLSRFSPGWICVERSATVQPVLVARITTSPGIRPANS